MAEDTVAGQRLYFIVCLILSAAIKHTVKITLYDVSCTATWIESAWLKPEELRRLQYRPVSPSQPARSYSQFQSPLKLRCYAIRQRHITSCATTTHRMIKRTRRGPRTSGSQSNSSRSTGCRGATSTLAGNFASASNISAPHS